MSFNPNFRTLRSVIQDPLNLEEEIHTDFKVEVPVEYTHRKIFAPYLHVSGVLKELISSDAEDASPTFVSDDGVVLPLNFDPVNKRFHSLEKQLKTWTFS
jgi:hypothetical protein